MARLCQSRTLAMLGQIATFAFATAGCLGAAVIGISLRDALPRWGRLLAERRALADDRVYLFTLIETPRHDGTAAPMPATQAVPAAQAVIHPVRRRVPGLAVPLRAAA
jgi:hypothetical protein